MDNKHSQFNNKNNSGKSIFPIKYKNDTGLLSSKTNNNKKSYNLNSNNENLDNNNLGNVKLNFKYDGNIDNIEFENQQKVNNKIDNTVKNILDSDNSKIFKNNHITRLKTDKLNSKQNYSKELSNITNKDLNNKFEKISSANKKIDNSINKSENHIPRSNNNNHGNHGNHGNYHNKFVRNNIKKNNSINQNEIESKRISYYNNNNNNKKMENPSIKCDIVKNGNINEDYAYSCYLEFLQKNPEIDLEYEKYYDNVFKQKEIEDKAKKLQENISKKEINSFKDYDMLSDLNDLNNEIKVEKIEKEFKNNFNYVNKSNNLMDKIYSDLISNPFSNHNNYVNVNSNLKHNNKDLFYEFEDDDIIYKYELNNNLNHNHNQIRNNRQNNNIDQEELDVINDLMFMNVSDPINEYEQGIINEIYPDIDNMSSEQIMELQEKLGYVSKGLSKQKIQSIKSVSYDPKIFGNSDR